MGRLGGPFPFPIAQVQEGGSRVDLPSGGVWYPPSGQFLFVLDANSIIQYFDPQAQAWQTLMGHSTGGPLTVDGFNYRVLNDSGVLKAFTITSGGSTMPNGIGSVATGVTVGFTGGTGGTLADTPTAYAIVGGVVSAPTVSAGGSFAQIPLIVIDPPPPGGIQAYAHAVMSGTPPTMTISSVVMDNGGAGYVGTPNFWIIPQVTTYAGGPQGSLAASPYPPTSIINPANAVPGNQNIGPGGAWLVPGPVTSSGVLTGLVLGNPGGNWTSAPTVVLTGAIGAAATVTIGTAAAVATVLSQPRIND